ncbi:MAG: oligoribonuclease [Actinobacteria bacterium]|nr:oligoribonuclease [Actinomycetota bacterium]
MTNGPIVWIDCEMTGLDLDRDALVEVAVVVTDENLAPLDDGIDLVIAPPAEALAGMDPFVVDMHTTSGLLPELADGITLEQARDEVLAYIRRHVPEARKAPLAGSSVHMDRSFLSRDMPEIVDHLHYRIIDVSSLKELVRRWYPRVYFAAPQKRGGHRALADILDSIRELQYYRQTVLVPMPGPSTDDARAIAASIDAAE